MRHRRSDPVFPDGLPDETTSALSEFLHQLAAACDSRYFVQLRRYRHRQMNLYDPDSPWRTPPPDLP
jgi:hypothetical protein